MKMLSFSFIFPLVSLFFFANTGASFQPSDRALPLFDFKLDKPKRCKKALPKCYSAMDLVMETLESNLNGKVQLQHLFQSIKQTRVTMAQILPHINPYNIANNIFNFQLADLIPFVGTAVLAQDMVENITTLTIDTFLPVAGFLFPNRWYDWRASRNVMHAQEEALNSVFATKTLSSLQVYFDIERQIWLIRILKFYIREIDDLIEILENQTTSDGKKRATPSDIAILKNYIGVFHYNRSIIDALSSVKPHLATLMGLTPSVDWDALQTKGHKIRSLRKISPGKYFDYWPDAKRLSPELKNIRYSINAAKNNKRSVTFDIFDPESSDNIDFGYSARIKMARANVAILQLMLKQSKRQISTAIQTALNRYNKALQATIAIEDSLKYLVGIRDIVEENIDNTSVPLNITKIARFLQYAGNQQLLFVNAYFTFREAEATLMRYSWRGPYYEVVRDYINHQVPKILKKIERRHSFRKTFIYKFRHKREREL